MAFPATPADGGRRKPPCDPPGTAMVRCHRESLGVQQGEESFSFRIIRNYAQSSVSFKGLAYPDAISFSQDFRSTKKLAKISSTRNFMFYSIYIYILRKNTPVDLYTQLQGHREGGIHVGTFNPNFVFLSKTGILGKIILRFPIIFLWSF